MKTGKIIQKFFSEKEAVNAKSYQRAKAKRDKVVILKVEKIDAYELFKTNGWLKKSPFKKLGIPVPGQFMVIVHYNHNVVAVKKTSALKKNIIAASKLKDTAKRFKIVRLNEMQIKQVAGFGYVSNITVPAFRFKYRQTYTIGKMTFKTVMFLPPAYSYSAAA